MKLSRMVVKMQGRGLFKISAVLSEEMKGEQKLGSPNPPLQPFKDSLF
jgi:hypothetical protein